MQGDGEEVFAMIEWGSDDWCGNVHYESNGSSATHRRDEATYDD